MVFILGILTQGIGVGVFFMFVPLAVALCALLLRRGYVAIMALSFTVGYAVAYINQPPPLQSRMMDRELDYSGVVSALTDYDSGRGLIVEIDSCEGMPCGKILVKAFIPSSLPVVDETDRIDFSASLTPLVHKPDLPDGIDFGAHLRREGVVAECLIRPGSIEAVRAEPGFINSIRRLRGKITGLIASSSLGSSSKEFLNAIMTGDRSCRIADLVDIHDAFPIMDLRDEEDTRGLDNNFDMAFCCNDRPFPIGSKGYCNGYGIFNLYHDGACPFAIQLPVFRGCRNTRFLTFVNLYGRVSAFVSCCCRYLDFC